MRCYSDQNLKSFEKLEKDAKVLFFSQRTIGFNDIVCIQKVQMIEVSFGVEIIVIFGMLGRLNESKKTRKR